MTWYEFVSLDVWGNARDGFEVNNAFRTGTTVEIPDEADHKAIVRILKDEGILKKDVRPSRVEIDDSTEGVIYVNDARNGRPEFQFHKLATRKVVFTFNGEIAMEIPDTGYPARDESSAWARLSDVEIGSHARREGERLGHAQRA